MNVFVPAATIDEVIERLDIIIATCSHQGNRGGYFAALYKRVTVSVKEHIAQGYFEDNARMERLDVIFANRYLEAHHKAENGLPCSVSWKVAFDAAREYHPLVIQHLFVGMNAHIGLDLGLAAAEVQPHSLESLHTDFNRINEVLGALVNTVQDELSTIFWPLKPIDWLAGGVDEKLAGFAMTIARDAAWECAQQCVQVSGEQREAYIRERDRSVAGFGAKIIRPGRWVNFLVSVFRPLERGKVSWKIGVLNKT